MRFFTSPQFVELSPEAIQRAKQFAENVVGTTNYADTNQTNIEKVKDDHFISKLGEEAVKCVFEQLGKSVKGPDYNIYQALQKSWEDDLYIDQVALAVKTQKSSAARRYGLSWTFQCGGSRIDPILRRPDAWVCFVECDDAHPHYRCKVFIPYRMNELTLGEPKLEYLKGKKKVAYAVDLPKFP